MTQRFTADPGVMEYNGRVYVYTTNDSYMYDSSGNVTDNNYSNITTINCMSSSDMINWTDHGSINVQEVTVQQNGLDVHGHQQQHIRP